MLSVSVGCPQVARVDMASVHVLVGTRYIPENDCDYKYGVVAVMRLCVLLCLYSGK